MHDGSETDQLELSAVLPQRRRRRWLTATVGIILCAAGIVVYKVVQGPVAPGDEVTGYYGGYGYSASMDLGHRFTDGLTHLRVSSEARGPLRLISAQPSGDNGGVLRVLGVLARVVPDMLPPGHKTGWFQENPGFPPSKYDATGAVAVNGLVARVPNPGEYLSIEIQIGYEVTAPGRYTRRGVELIYDYQGARHKVIIPSHLAICAPANAPCAANDGY